MTATTGNGVDNGATKPTNPKDAIGSRKAPLGLVPDTLILGAAEALLEGALKYGRYNWRIAGVRAHIYHDAMERHLKKWWNGQDAASDTKVHHLKSIIACAGILLDAELYGKLIDDRPPCPNPDAMAEAIDAMEARVAELRELFKAHNPYQFTIADTPRAPHFTPEQVEYGAKAAVENFLKNDFERPALVSDDKGPWPVAYQKAAWLCPCTVECQRPIGHEGECYPGSDIQGGDVPGINP